MFTVVVQEKGGKNQRLQFNKGEITVGRVQGNDIVLPKGNVSKRHSKVVYKEGKFIVVDLKSTNGTYVNGHKIASPQVVKSTDKIFIGDFVIEIEEKAGGPANPAPVAAPAPSPPAIPNMGGPRGGMGGPQPPMPPVNGPGRGMPPGPGLAGPPGPGLAGPPRPAPVGPGPVARGNGQGWQDVNVQGNNPYKYLRVQGGWMVSSSTGLLFINDPQHQFAPVPV